MTIGLVLCWNKTVVWHRTNIPTLSCALWRIVGKKKKDITVGKLLSQFLRWNVNYLRRFKVSKLLEYKHQPHSLLESRNQSYHSDSRPDSGVSRKTQTNRERGMNLETRVSCFSWKQTVWLNLAAVTQAWPCTDQGCGLRLSLLDPRWWLWTRSRCSD